MPLTLAIVDQFRNEDAIQRGLDVRTMADDANGIPDAWLECCLGFDRLHRIKPASASFVIDTGAPLAIGWIDLTLVAPHAIAFLANLTSELYPAVQGRMWEILVFEDEVPVFAVGAQKGVRRIGYAGAYDGTVLDRVGRLAAMLFPTVERLAIFSLTERSEERRVRLNSPI